MADTKTSALPDAGTLSGSELVPVVQSGSNVKSALSALLAWITAALITAKRLIPTGGSPGEYLRRVGIDGDHEWSSAGLVPDSSNAGYVLTQRSGTAGDYGFEPIRALPDPSGAVEGEVITLDSTGAPVWGRLPIKRRAITAIQPGSTALTHVGLTVTGEGTGTGVVPSNTAPPKSALARVNYASAATAGSSAGIRFATLYLYRGLDASTGGFRALFIFSPNDLAPVADRRCFVGLIAATGVFGNVNPSTKTNCFGVGADSGDTDLSIIHNDSSGTATKIALTGFAQADTAAIYDLEVWCAPGASALSYRVSKRVSGGPPTVLQGSVSTEIPDPDTLLTHYFWANNGTTASAVSLAFAYYEVETYV